MTALGLAAELNRASYTGFDFDTHFDDLLARLQVKFAADFNDFALSSLGIVLLDLTSFGLDTLSFYLDRRATEAYLVTARTRRAVSRLTRQMGYKMGAAVAASVDLSVYINTPVNFAVTIPEKFQFQGPDGLIFENATDFTFPANSGPETTVILTATQSETITEEFRGDGTPNQVFELAQVPDGDFSVSGTLVLTVDGDLYTEKQFLSFEQDAQNYEFSPNDDPPTIRFGNGGTGAIPAEGAPINVSYSSSRGVGGLVLANTIDDVVSPLVAGPGPTPVEIDLIVTNTVPSSGGADPETLEHAKIFAPKVYKSRRVALTRQDYEALAGAFADPQFGRVAVAQALISRSAQTDLTLQTILKDIREKCGEFEPITTGAMAAIDALVASITAEVSILTAALTGVVDVSLDERLQNISQNLDTLDNNADASRTTSQNLATDSQALQTSITDITAGISVPTRQIVSVTGPVNFLLPTGVNGNRIQRTSGSWVDDKVFPGMKLQVSNTLLNNKTFTVSQTTLTNNTDPKFLTVSESVADETGVADVAFTTDLAANDRLSSATKAGLLDDINNADAKAQAIVGNAGLVLSQAEAQQQLVSAINLDMAAIGTDVTTSGTLLKTMYDSAVSIGVSNALISVQTVLVLDTITNIDTELETLTNKIETHVSKFLAEDCKANLVTVPILTKDVTGFYVAPSQGLVTKLSEYLETIKGITQSVEVTSGFSFLVPALVTARIGVKDGYKLGTVKNAVAAAIDDVLKCRKFGACLYLYELDEAVRLVAGVAFKNISIDGIIDSNGNDSIGTNISKGNLIISTGEIVTKGRVDITTVAASEECP